MGRPKKEEKEEMETLTVRVLPGEADMVNALKEILERESTQSTVRFLLREALRERLQDPLLYAELADRGYDAERFSAMLRAPARSAAK